jgi:hypothetical protein
MLELVTRVFPQESLQVHNDVELSSQSPPIYRMAVFCFATQYQGLQPSIWVDSRSVKDASAYTYLREVEQ